MTLINFKILMKLTRLKHVITPYLRTMVFDLYALDIFSQNVLQSLCYILLPNQAKHLSTSEIKNVKYLKLPKSNYYSSVFQEENFNSPLIQ